MPVVELSAARLAADGEALHSIAQAAWQAARACQTALSGTGGMAGDEESAETFANGQDGEPGYDGYAADLLTGVINTANTLKTLDALLTNTARAYDGAQLVGAFRSASESSIPEATATPYASSVSVPSALGPGPQTPLGEFGEFLQDALATIGVRLPDADTGKLSSAVSAWTELSGAMSRVQGRVDGAFSNTSAMTFPQKSTVLACQTKVSSSFGKLGESAESMAQFAQAMIDETNKAWEEIGWFIAQMAVEIAVEIGVGALLGAITFGAGAAAMAAKIAFTVMRWAVKIANLCKKLRTLIMGALRAARAAIRVGMHAAREALSAGLASTITTVSFNAVRGAIDPEYTPQNVLTAALAATAGGGAGGAFSRVGGAATSRVTSTGLRRATHVGVEMGSGAVDGLVGAGVESGINGTPFNPLGAVVLGSLLGGAMAGKPPGSGPRPAAGGGGVSAPSAVHDVPSAVNAGGSSSSAAVDGGGAVTVNADAPTPGASGGGGTAAGDGSSVTVSNDAPTPGAGDAGGGGAGDGTSVDVSSSAPDLPQSLAGDGPAAPGAEAPSVEAPSIETPSTPDVSSTPDASSTPDVSSTPDASSTPDSPAAADLSSAEVSTPPDAGSTPVGGVPTGSSPSTPTVEAPSAATEAPTAPHDAPDSAAADPEQPAPAGDDAGATDPDGAGEAAPEPTDPETSAPDRGGRSSAEDRASTTAPAAPQHSGRQVDLTDGTTHTTTASSEQIEASGASWREGDFDGKPLDEFLADRGWTPEQFNRVLDTHARYLTPADVEILAQVRDRITVDSDTWMQKVVSDDQALTYLYNEHGRFNSPDTTYGFTARAVDVADMTTPRDIFERLALNYEGTPFSRRDRDMTVIRYQPWNFSAQEIPRHSGLFGDTGHRSQETWDAGAWEIAPGRGRDAQPIADRLLADPRNPGGFLLPHENPFVGAGWSYGSQGAPELHTGDASEMRAGAEMWSIRSDGSQQLMAVLKWVDVDGTEVLNWVEVV